ncbi:ABC transporter substrate-binding protein [Solicola sp. PLA-1-18]|uniref:ABC transporter substrate-binding protein n=1 Tax=Solicola sp. PLA-1-18 TaxID=3380532 RepID=UPI003B7998CE
MPVPPSAALSRRALLAGAAALALTACGASGSSDDASPAATSDGTFPVEITHKFGTITIPSEPRRVVVAGLTEQDVLLQLGVVPIATTEWYGEQPDAVWPWATELLDGAKPTVLSQTDGLQFEKIASLEPDLIVAVNGGLEEADYDKLAAIAPTLAGAKGTPQYFSPWDDQTVLVATALGRKAEGEKLVADVKAQYAEIAKAHPDWDGKTATFAQGAPYEGVLYVYQNGLSTDFLTMMGFTITAGLEEYSPAAGEQAQISAENLDEIEADVVLFATEEQDNFTALRSLETYASLPAVAEKRAVYTDATLAGAIYFMTPLSLAYVADRLPPLLEKAVAGESPQELQG